MPHLEKSIIGLGAGSSPLDNNICIFIYAFKSSFVILPLSPVPFIVSRLIPSSLERRLTPGEAKTLFGGPTSESAGSMVSAGLGVGSFSSFGLFFISCASSFCSFCSTSRLSIFNKACPVLIVSPTETSISFTVPLFSAGISIEALSDSKTKTVSSDETLSPIETDISLTSAPSMPSPKSGKINSLVIASSYTVIGLGFSGSMLYFFIASSAFEISTLPSIAKALIAVKTI